MSLPVHLCPECGRQWIPSQWQSREHSMFCQSANFAPPAPTEYQAPPRRTDWPYEKTETDSRG